MKRIYESDELEKIQATVSQYDCPICHNSLVFRPLDGGIKLWCPNSMVICPSIGTNEGGYGKKEADAFKILTDKLSFGTK